MLRLRVVSQLGHPPASVLQAQIDAVGTIGRSPDCSLVLPDPRRHISREQARIERGPEGYRIRCTGSASAILVNGAEVQPGEAAPLKAGDSIIISEYEIAAEAVQAPVSGASPLSVPPVAAASSTADPLQALGLAPVPAAVPAAGASDPLGLGLAPTPQPARTPQMFKPAVAEPHPDSADPLGLAVPGPPPDAVIDPLRMAPSAQPVLDASRRGADSIDDLFGLGGASADPLREGSGLALPQARPNTSSAEDPLISLGQTPVAPPAAEPDNTPELSGSFRLPQVIPRTSFGFDDPEHATVELPPDELPGLKSASPVTWRSWSPPPGSQQPSGAPAAAPEPRREARDASSPPATPSAAASGAPVAQSLPPVASASPSEEQIRAIAQDAAARHRVNFEPPPKTQPTALLEKLNQEHLQRLRGQGAMAVAAAQSAQSAHGEPPADVPGSLPGAANVADPSFELLKALLLGLGLSELPRPPLKARGAPPELTPELMRRLGELTRVSAQGTIDLLHARATLKREMKTEVTLIAAHDNNPLKFSPDAQAALVHLLSTQSIRGFLDPVPALEDAYQDLLAHQVGFIAGMRAAMQGLIARFDPATLESRLTRKSVIDSMLPGSRRARLWELFTELFAEISREAEDDFETLFGREFVRAYEEQIERLKRGPQ